MRFTSEQRLDDGVLEREFTLGEISGILWTPASAPASAPAPLILLGHPPLGLRKMYPRLAVCGPRISAAVLCAGSLVPAAMFEDARRVTIPLHVLLQWDDEGNDRQAALDLFDAFGSKEKTLHANMGGHTGVPQFAGDAAARFFTRHLS